MNFGIYVIFSYHFGPSINTAPASSSLYSHSYLQFFSCILFFESLLIWLQIRFHVYYSTSLFAKVRCVKNLGDKDFLSSLYLPFRYSANL